jgi:hypothetical protein
MSIVVWRLLAGSLCLATLVVGVCFALFPASRLAANTERLQCPVPLAGYEPLPEASNRGEFTIGLDGGVVNVACVYWMPNSPTFGYGFTLEWAENERGARYVCSGMEDRTNTGKDIVEVTRVSRTKAAKVYIKAQKIDVTPLVPVGETLRRSIEARAVACPSQTASQPVPATSAAPAAAGATPQAVVATVAPDANVLPDSAYQEPGVVADEGIASKVLEPGSELPGAGEAAAAAGVLATGAAAVGVSELARRRRETNPIVELGKEWVGGEATAIKQDEARRVLRRTLPERWRAGVDRLDDPLGALTSLGSAARDPRNLGKAVRQTLVNEPRVVQHILSQHGFTPPMVNFFGGTGHIVKTLERVVRNPPKAIGAGLKDLGRNLTHPDELLRHIRHGIERVVDATPFGMIGRGLKHLLGHRKPRAPRSAATQPAPDLSMQQPRVSVSEGGTPTQLSSTRPEPMVDPDPRPGERADPR